jgi:hypothetical protein
MADFPRLIKLAAETWSNDCSAFVQIRNDSNTMKLRLQAIEIMQQFVGDVQFGKDPKGILFYNNAGDFLIGYAEVRYYKHGTGSNVTIQADFHESRMPRPFARFLARVNTQLYPLPVWATATGSGNWSAFRAATSETDVLRIGGSPRLNLRFRAIGKSVHFDTARTDHISNVMGLLIFRDIERLRDMVDNQPCVADYAPDRIVFHPRGLSADKDVVALFLPSVPLLVGTTAQPPTTRWEPYRPPAMAMAAEGEAEGEEEADGGVLHPTEPGETTEANQGT